MAANYDDLCLYSRPPPRTARTGSLQEIVTEGGEVTFVTKLIQESLILKNKIRYAKLVFQKYHLFIFSDVGYFIC